MQTAKKVLQSIVATVLTSVLMVGIADSQDMLSNSESANRAGLDAATNTGFTGATADVATPDDGSDTGAAVDATVDAAAIQAAAANDEIEWAAMDSLPEPVGDPIVPQQKPDRPDIPDGSEPDPLATTAPPANGFTQADYAVAQSGTRSAITFKEVRVAAAELALTPHMQLEVGTAARSRFVTLAAAELSSALDAQFITIDLFDGVSIQLATDVAPSPGALGSTMYSGGGAQANAFTDENGNKVESDMGVITIRDGRVAGDFWADGKQYGLRTIDSSVAAIYEVARSFPPQDPHEFGINEPGPSNGPSGLTAAELGVDNTDIVGLPAVEVMIAYDAEAFVFYGSSIETVRAEAAAMVNLTNQTYRNTEQQQHMNLTGLYATGVTPNTNDIFTYRNQLAHKSDGNFDGVHAVRDSQGADFVVLLSNRINTFGYCGVAFFPTSADPAENDAYNVTEASCAISGLTFPHELGHNQCAGHDNLGSNPCAGQPGSTAGYVDGRGLSDAGANKRTIMARNSQPGIRQPVWSKPNHVYQGWTHGDATHNNALVLEVEDLGGVSGGVANYRVGNGVSAAVAGIDGQSCIYGSLEQAFSNAPTGSTIFVAPGIYVGQSTINNFNITRSMDVEQGTTQCEPTTSGVATNVILRPAAGSNSDGVLEIRAPNVRLERITIEGGTSAEGNVEVENSGTLVLDGVIIRNGNNPANGGGLIVKSSNNSAEMINNGQIVNNTAVNGGGVYVNGGAFTINDTDDVEDNNATDGGGIYATGGALVVVKNNGDVLSNTASGDGGGVHLTGDADLEVFDSSSFIGFGGQDNTASRGGGVFVEVGSTGSMITLRDGGQVRGNSANFGAGVYLLNGELEVNDGGEVLNNTGGNGAGILAVNNPDTTTIVDLNPGSRILGNSGGLGAGIYMSTNTMLDINGSVIQNNTSSSSGGGLYLSHNKGAAILDSTFSGNSAADGGGILNSGSGILTTVSNSTFSGNTGTSTAGALANSGTLDLIINSTFSGNIGNGGAAAGIHNTGGTIVAVRNTIVTGSTGPDCTNAGGGTFSTGSNNLTDDLTCPGDSALDAAKFDTTLADNGCVTPGWIGCVKTHALLYGSNAIDAAVAGTVSDQRGYAAFNGRDIGAWESADQDNDGLGEAEEIALGTNPKKADTDHDGLSDGDEVNIYNTNPLKADTDGDGYSDGDEVKAGSDPLDPKSTPRSVKTLFYFQVIEGAL